MKLGWHTLKTCILSCIAATALSTGAQAAQIDFEDLYLGYDDSGQFDLNYGGYEWEGVLAYVTSNFIEGRGMQLGTSGNVSVVATGGDLAFTRNRAFNLNNVRITSGWNLDENVTVEGWRNGVMVYSTAFQSSFDAPRAFPFDFRNIDRFSIHGEGGTDGGSQRGEGIHLVIDDIVISELPTTDVPEPAAGLLFGMGGLMLLVATRLRRRTKR